MNKLITKRTDDYNQWYQDVVEQADLAENSVVRGCMVIKPYGYAIWENIQKELDKRIKETGHKNLYFPLFVPKSTLEKEAEHVEGFAKESAVVTHHRLIQTETGLGVDPESKLEEELIVRPTSEAVMYEMFSKWIKSWRDLPLLVNQWANVVRWEMRTKLFLRTTEFLWQEGHTVHTAENGAEEEALKMLNVYKNFVEEYLAMSPIVGNKSENEKFPGALRTYTLEALMQDGKALQAGTSHNLGNNFAKAFDIKYQDQNGNLTYAWQTSWGMSTRIIGGLIMTHSDDKGLILPPKIAPIQVIIIPILGKENNTTVMEYANKLMEILANNNIKTEIDNRDYQTTGEKFNEWEKKGVPVRMEIGLKEIESNQIKFVNRINGTVNQVTIDNCVELTKSLLDQIQQTLKTGSESFRNENTYHVQTYDEFKKIAEAKKGFIKTFWCEDVNCEIAIKEQTKATTRCLELNYVEQNGNCIYCGKTAKHMWVFCQAH